MKKTEDKECFLHGARISLLMNDIADISLQVQKVVHIRSYEHHLRLKEVTKAIIVSL
jgi:ribosome recycling factor